MWIEQGTRKNCRIKIITALYLRRFHWYANTTRNIYGSSAAGYLNWDRYVASSGSIIFQRHSNTDPLRNDSFRNSAAKVFPENPSFLDRKSMQRHSFRWICHFFRLRSRLAHTILETRSLTPPRSLLWHENCRFWLIYRSRRDFPTGPASTTCYRWTCDVARCSPASRKCGSRRTAAVIRPAAARSIDVENPLWRRGSPFRFSSFDCFRDCPN